MGRMVKGIQAARLSNTRATPRNRGSAFYVPLSTNLSPAQLMHSFTPNTEGIFEDLPAHVYHAAPGVSNSMLKNMEPPARLPVYLAEKREPTAAQIIGTL